MGFDMLKEYLKVAGLFLFLSSSQVNAQTVPLLPGQSDEKANKAIVELKMENLPKLQYVVKDKDFVKYAEPKPTNSGMTDIMVFFWYGSDWVQKVDPLLREWQKGGRFPTNARINWVPLVLPESGKEWYFSARIFFALQQMGQEKTITPLLMKAVQSGVVDLQSPKSVSTFLNSRGIELKAFEKALNDPLVIAKVSQLQSVAKLYQVRSTPSYVIDGQYLISSNTARSPERATAIMMFMVENLSKGGSRP